MVYLISYDILDRNKADEDPVLAKLKSMGATRCLYSEWLYESGKSVQQIGNEVAAVTTEGDRLLVVALGSEFAYTSLLNEKASLAVLARA